jgi:hypothetical protein
MFCPMRVQSGLSAGKRRDLLWRRLRLGLVRTGVLVCFGVLWVRAWLLSRAMACMGRLVSAWYGKLNAA